MLRFAAFPLPFLFGLVACAPSEKITFDWHNGLSPVLQSEQWRISSDGHLYFTREKTSVFSAQSRQITRAERRISKSQFQELSSVLEPIRLAAERQGGTPCSLPDGPGFSVKYERSKNPWQWSSEIGCAPQSAAVTMEAAFNAKQLLERWTGSVTGKP